jgi:hypothetical protein
MFDEITSLSDAADIAGIDCTFKGPFWRDYESLFAA